MRLETRGKRVCRRAVAVEGKEHARISREDVSARQEFPRLYSTRPKRLRPYFVAPRHGDINETYETLTVQPLLGLAADGHFIPVRAGELKRGNTLPPGC